MGLSSGPQPGAGLPAAPATDPHSPEVPSALGDSSALSSSAQHDAAPQASSAAAGAQQQPAEETSLQRLPGEDAASYESRHVHNVYEAIAPHFSSTRYKPWPLVASFLLSLPPGSVGLDAGCGNGKYLAVNPSLFIIASDRSANLVSLARDYQPPFFDDNSPATAAAAAGAGAASGSKKKNKNKNAPPSETPADSSAPAPAPAPPRPPKNQVLVADSLALPYRESAFDFAISIAVVHHLSTRQRRQAAVAALLAAVRPGTGKVLVYVWALEQSSSRRGWDAGAAQDQLVPWVTKGKAQPQQPQQPPQSQDVTFQRYYHLYRQGELEEDVVEVGGRVLESGYVRDNWWVICCRDS
ncbi:hypothetical protein EsH8_II_001016 [Colletotrichum jinshuiense]